MQLKASDERNNDDFDDLKLELTPFGKDLSVKLTLTNGNEIEFTNGELFYVDDDPDNDKIALNVYTTVESDDSDTGLGMGDDIGVYAECVCHLD